MQTTDKYILDENKNPIPEPNLLKWGRWMEKNDEKRKVAFTEMGNVKISTVFLGLDHSFLGAVPILFETMIFGGPFDSYQDRCSTYADALEMHRKAVEFARNPPTDESEVW